MNGKMVDNEKINQIKNKRRMNRAREQTCYLLNSSPQEFHFHLIFISARRRASAAAWKLPKHRPTDPITLDNLKLVNMNPPIRTFKPSSSESC